MLLNEFLKEHRMVQELKSIVAKQEAAAAQQQTEIRALTSEPEKAGRRTNPEDWRTDRSSQTCAASPRQ
jgi:uncharacterized coiled-coil protein SlyX